MMRYTKFDIKDYKGIKSLQLDLSAYPELNITVLVGLNESGKTTVLEAISYLQEGIDKSDAYKLIPRDKSSNFTGDVSVKATLRLEPEDQKKLNDYCESKNFYLAAPVTEFQYERRYSFKGSEPESTKTYWTIALNGRKSKQARKNIDLHKEDIARWTEIVNYIESDLMPRVIYYPNFLFDFPEKIYLDESSEQGKSQKQALYRKVLQDILDSLDEDLDLQTHIHERLKGGSAAQQNSLQAALLKMSGSITDNVIKPWDSIFKSTDNKEVIVQHGVEDEEGKPTQYYLTVQLRQGREIYQIEERSLGFKWFFAFLLFTEYRKNRSTDRGETLFLVDEPASNLHSTMQERLTDKVEAIVNKSHLIYTTHSQHLINPLWLESTFIVMNKSIDYSDEIESSTKQTDIVISPYKKFAAENPNQKDYFQPILDALDYKPSRLELVPEILIVEGKNDYYTLRYMWEVALDVKSTYSLYPGNGAKGNSQVIALYSSWARNFKVLLDADAAGKGAKEFYQDKFGALVEGRIFTLADVVSGWKTKSTEDLFSQKEQMEIINTLYPRQSKYSKEKFNLAIQSLLYKKQKLQLNKSTVERFQKIFDLIEG